jgi:tRNA(Ile)-lysidine synthase
VDEQGAGGGLGTRLTMPHEALDALVEKCSFPALGPVTCAVSGGADSCALLVLARHIGLDVTAVHVDHGIRPGSSHESEFVERVAKQWGAEFRSVSVVVEPGANLEARAREARYGALPDDVLTGHTADDMAETVLLQLMRGGGLDGSAGIQEDRRPLLGLRRADTTALCQALSIDYFVDPSNIDKRFKRNRVRAELIPLLSDISDRDVVPLLARAAEVARVDVDLLNELAATIQVADVAAMRAAPEALRRRAVRLWLHDGHPPSAAVVLRVLAVVDGEATSTQIGAGRVVRRSKGILTLELAPHAGEHNL